MSKLIVSLPYPNAASHSGVTTSGGILYDFVLSKDGQNEKFEDSPNRGKTGALSLSELPKADTTVLVVPARALSWHQVDLPKVPKARLRAALDGLLEEHLLDDTSAMALALSPDAQAGKASLGAWVAACDKAWLSTAIQAFETAGFRVTQVVPEFWPQSEPMICVSGTPEEAWITRADAQGVMTIPLHVGDTSGVLQALLANFPSSTPVSAAPAVAALAEASLLSYPELKIQLRQHATGLLHSGSSLWELAQFEQSLSGDSQGMKSMIRQWKAFWQAPAWRPARWGLVALLLANIIGLNTWAWKQQASLSSKRAQLGTILTQTFPNVKTVVDPALQMSREMVVLRQATGANGVQNFESMLSAFSTSNSNIVSGLNTPTAIEYVANNLNLKNIKLVGGDLTTMKSKLKTMGYVLTQSGDMANLKVQPAP
jgi:general secretion pathway protein L